MGEKSCGCKIGTVAKVHSLSDLNEVLIERREARNASLRDLARVVNIQVLSARLETTDGTELTDPAMIYDVMTDEEVSTARRVHMTDALANRGIDWEELADDFVSYQTVRRHFQGCLDRPTARQGIETLAEGREVLAWAREHHENVLERTLQRLARVDALDIDEVRPSINVMVTCESCDRTHDLEALVERGGCTCQN